MRTVDGCAMKLLELEALVIEKAPFFRNRAQRENQQSRSVSERHRFQLCARERGQKSRTKKSRAAISASRRTSFMCFLRAAFQMIKNKNLVALGQRNSVTLQV